MSQSQVNIKKVGKLVATHFPSTIVSVEIVVLINPSDPKEHHMSKKLDYTWAGFVCLEDLK